MTPRRSKSFAVVETNDGKVFLGTIARRHGTVTVYSGYTGRPPVILATEIDSITPAEEHPDVVIR